MIDFVYIKKGSEYVRTTHLLGKAATQRSISDRSTVTRRGADTVVGVPYELTSPAGRNLPEKHIIQDVSMTNPEQLARVALDLCNWAGGKLQWRDGVPYTMQRLKFRDALETGVMREKPAEWSVELAHELIGMSLRQPGQSLRRLLNIKKESEELWHKSGSTTRVKQEQIEEFLSTLSGLTKKSMPHKPMTVIELDRAVSAYLARFEQMLPLETQREQIRAASPDITEYYGMTISLAYRNGVPHISRITDTMKRNLLQTTGPLRLSDGRDIIIPHTVNKHSKQMTIDQFRDYFN